MKVIISSQSPILGRIRLWLSWFKLKCHLLVLIYDRRWFLRVLHSEKLIESHKNRIHSFNPRWLIFSYILTKTSTDTCGSIVIKFGSLVEHLKKKICLWLSPLWNSEDATALIKLQLFWMQFWNKIKYCIQFCVSRSVSHLLGDRAVLFFQQPKRTILIVHLIGFFFIYNEKIYI